MTLRAEIKKKLEKLVPKGAEFSVFRPERPEFGDYSSNVAMVSKGNPLEAAEEFKKKLEKSDLFEKVEVAGPGFLNFFISPEVFIKNVEKITEEKDGYGRNEILSNQKVIVEYTDPNPFKEFHIGHLMSNAIGESLARVFEASGAEVRRANYQGDVGLRVAKAVWGALKQNSSVDWGKAYVAGDRAYKEDESAKKDISAINKKVYERSDAEINKLYDEGKKISLEYFEKIYKRLGTKFDFYFFESEGGIRGKKIVEDGLKKSVFEESDGAVVFKGERAGLHTRVFLSSEGLPTYEAKELGLAPMKYEKYRYDLSYIITGNEIIDYFRVLMAAMKEMFPELAAKTHHVPHGMLRFASGKMSSRIGNIITAQALLDDVQERILKIMKKAKELSDKEMKEISDKVAVGAVKYSILRQSIGKDIIFDFKTSLSFEGDSGPYLQYTHARACSVVGKANSAGIKPSVSNPPDEVGNVERVLSAFPETVERAYADLSPSHVASYLIELAHAFNSFYAKERIADAGEKAPYRVALAKATAQVLENGLWLLGISAPKRM